MTTTGSALARMHGVIIDMDGVLFRGSLPIPGASEFLGFLERMDIPFLLLTNNSTRTAKQYVTKLSDMGMRVDEEKILTTSMATAMYLSQVAPPGTEVYMVGEEGLRVELEKKGFALLDGPDVPYVVVGYDRTFTYEKMETATLAVRAGAKFIATNPDRTYPGERGIVPGAGAILASIEAATDVAPTIVGKPQRAIFELALRLMQAEAKGAAMVGDRLETDILGAQQLGLLTILLLSGVTSAQQLESSLIVPDLVCCDIAALHLAWRSAIDVKLNEA